MTKRRVASAALLSVLFGCSGGSGGGDGGPLGEHGPPAPGTRCSLAESVTLTGGTLTVSGSTAGATDEYDGAVNCRSTQTTMVGPQRYYKLRLEQDVVYKVSLDAQFSGARVYFFTECGASAINSACGSGGSKGAISPSLFGGRAFFFLPPTGGDWIVAVDSTSQQSPAATSR